MFIDLNGFKHINDSFGHPVGDEVLGRVGRRLQASLRPGDLLARVGGDEFAALVIGAGSDDALAIARNLSASLVRPFALDAVRAGISASIGIALAPEDAGDPDGMMACADAAMYRAKLDGVPFARYDGALDRGGDKLRLADELSAAIASGELVLHYQPQLELAQRRVATVEALVRWPHPEHGLIGPLTFLPLAEQAGLMPKLTQWVLTSALAQCSRWRAASRPVRVSVNISAGDLVDPGFPDAVAELLTRHAVPAEALLLEITETSIIEEFARTKHTVARLRELGPRFPSTISGPALPPWPTSTSWPSASSSSIGASSGPWPGAGGRATLTSSAPPSSSATPSGCRSSPRALRTPPRWSCSTNSAATSPRVMRSVGRFRPPSLSFVPSRLLQEGSPGRQHPQAARKPLRLVRAQV